MPVNSVTAANNGRIGCAFYFIKIVVKAKVEQNENNAYIRPYGNIVAVNNVWQQRKVRAGQKTCQHIAQNKRLVKLFCIKLLPARPASKSWPGR